MPAPREASISGAGQMVGEHADAVSVARRTLAAPARPAGGRRDRPVAHAAELTLPAAEKAPAWLYTLHRINMGDLEYIHKAGEPQSPFRDDILAGRVVLIVRSTKHSMIHHTVPFGI